MGATSDAIRDTGRYLATLPDDQFVSGFNDAIASIFPALSVGPATIYDQDGAEAGPFECVVSTAPIQAGRVPSEGVACAACAYATLDVQTLRDGYDLIGQAKALKKPAAAGAKSTTSMGLIVAARSALPLIKMAEEMQVQNRIVADDRRCDMVVVLSRGVANYAARFTGDRGLQEWVPPQNGTRTFVPPMILYLTTTATIAFSLNRLVGYIVGQLAFFAAEKPRPDMVEVVADVPGIRNIITTYQPNLAGQFIEVAEIEPIIMPPLVLTGPTDEVLCRLYYQPWQDGGVILNEGQLPMEALIPFIGKKIEMIFRPAPDRQITCVLPLLHQEFIGIGEQIQQRSNMKVRQQHQQLVLAKLLDEGTETPFVSRLWITPIAMRDNALGGDIAKLAEFDAIYQSILNDLTSLRRMGKETIELWKAHEAKVDAGNIVRVKQGLIETDETIDEPLNHNVETLIKNAASTIKQFQFLLKIFGTDIHFLYQEPKNFEAGLKALETNDPELAYYMRDARNWTEPIIKLRHELEHAPYVAPRISYTIMPDGKVRVVEPIVFGMPITHFIPTMLSRTNKFIEEVLMRAFQRTIGLPLTIVEIPVRERDPQKPERFKLGLAGSGRPWQVVYSDDDFDQI
jgi:hypothetical protein